MARSANGRPIAAAALDLGSTLLKAGTLDGRGRIVRERSLPAPPLEGNGDIRECDGSKYAAVADELLSWLVEQCPAETAVGIASQRSTFLLWDPETGKHATPMISWQDRRAAGWCTRHGYAEQEIINRTGLVLSAHYAGPKLAVTPERNKDTTLFGTLESYLLWRWSEGGSHETDLTMAARTAMFDLSAGNWSPELLSLYGVDASCLPRVMPTAGRSIPLSNGLRITATIADQAAGALALLADDECALVNLGTGAFVLKPGAGATTRIAGYLTGPVLGRDEGDDLFALEGSINGAGSAVDRYGREPSELPENDPSAAAFCIPDSAGLGSPYWRPDLGFTLSREAEMLDLADCRRIALEGLLFRVRQVIEDLSPGSPPERVLLSGGLSREPFIAPALAVLLERPVELVQHSEGTLTGAARLAASLQPFAEPKTAIVLPGSAGGYLPDKYGRWREWIDYVVAS
jgi:glycerol kinase